MLVLTRKLQETIHIGDNITLTILRIKGNTVRVGIDAPRQVRVVRGELPRKEEKPEAKEASQPMEFELDLSELAGLEAEGDNESPAWRREAPLASRVALAESAL